METESIINITDLQLRNLAENIPAEKATDLGLSLGLTQTDLASLIRTNDPIGNTFRVLVCWRTNLDPVLIQWRNKVEGKQTERLKLTSALKDRNLEHLIPCIDANVTVEENDSSLPIANLALPAPSLEADIKQEIEVIATLEGLDDAQKRTHQSHLYRLVRHAADTDSAWTRIRQLKAVFEPYAKLTNLIILPVRCTLDVVSLRNLRCLKDSIDNGQLTEKLSGVLLDEPDIEGAVPTDDGHVTLRLELDKESYSHGVQFFEDLEGRGFTQTQSTAIGDAFGAWESRRPSQDLLRTQDGEAKLVWRNVSQQSFGF